MSTIVDDRAYTLVELQTARKWLKKTLGERQGYDQTSDESVTDKLLDSGVVDIDRILLVVAQERDERQLRDVARAEADEPNVVKKAKK